MSALELFYAVGTDEARRIDWMIWQGARPGLRVIVATLNRVVEARVISSPQATAPEVEVMLLEHAGRRLKLKAYRSASSGYWDRHPEERYPGCDRDYDLDGLSARLIGLMPPREPEQLELW